MKAKHTPTPWVIEGELEHICVVNNESKDERACDGVRQVCWVGQGDFEYLDYDEALANAKLIAAAPELLFAARCALADLEGVMPEFEVSGDREHSGWRTIKELKAVIKKATK
jgi:hypothetical protein